MQRFFTLVILALAIGIGTSVTAGAARYDLAIAHARVFDVRSGTVRANATILIRDGKIVSIENVRHRFTATTTIDAAGRLVTPGLIDTHFHAGVLVGDSVAVDVTTRASDLRARFARAYLPFGITTVRSCGDPETWLPVLRTWMTRTPDSPDYYPCGGALVSPNDRHFAGHTEVNGPDEARAKVRAYHDAGFRHIKVYWRLREPELAAAMDEARKLDMNVTGHIDYKVVGIERAMALGLRHFEHAYTFGVDAIDSTGYAYINGQVFVDHYAPYIKDNSMPGSFFISRVEVFNLLGRNNPAMLGLIDNLHARGAGVTPTLHVFAQRFGLTYFTTPSTRPGYDDTDVLADSALVRCQTGYKILSGYVRRMFAAGIPLAVGSDWADPGKACLSEMLLLHECGIPMPDVFIAATWNGAVSMGIERDTGAIAPGYRANLVMFDGDPLQDPRALLGGKTVIKDGAVVR